MYFIIWKMIIMIASKDVFSWPLFQMEHHVINIHNFLQVSWTNLIYFWLFNFDPATFYSSWKNIEKENRIQILNTFLKNVGSTLYND